MSYFNPKIYNYSNLNESDRLLINCMLMCANELDSVVGDFECDLADEESSILDKIKAENGIEALQIGQQAILHHIVETMVAIIDNYEHDIPEIDTNDYFCGCTLFEDDELEVEE